MKKKSSTDLQVITGGLPALPEPTDNWKQFRILEQIADALVEEYTTLQAVASDLDERHPRVKPEDLVSLHRLKLSDDTKQQISRAKELLHALDREDFYEEGAEAEDADRILKKPVIAKRLALTMAAVHIGGPKVPAGFVKIMLAHIFDAQFSYPAFESGCRQIEATKKFVQTTSELLKVFQEQQSKWYSRRQAINDLKRLANHLQQKYADAEAAFVCEQAEDEVKRTGQNVTGKLAYIRRLHDELMTKQAAVDEMKAKIEIAEKNLIAGIAEMRTAETARDKIKAKIEAECQAKADAETKREIEAKYREAMKATNVDARPPAS